MKRWIILVALMVTGLPDLLIGPARADDTAKTQPTETKRYPARQFNSKVPLQVFVRASQYAPEKWIGKTPSDKPLEIPACHEWHVYPAEGASLADVVKESKAQAIPGLALQKSSKNDFAALEGLTSLRILILNRTDVTDDELEHLTGLMGLRILYLDETKVTDAGMEHLKGLTALQELHLCDKKLTDAGLEKLKGLTGLQTLDIFAAQLTDAGLVHLKDMTGLQSLWLMNTKVTDAGLEQLKGLRGLKELFLLGTKVTDAGAADLQKAIPGLYIAH